MSAFRQNVRRMNVGPGPGRLFAGLVDPQRRDALEVPQIPGEQCQVMVLRRCGDQQIQIGDEETPATKIGAITRKALHDGVVER